MALKPVEVELLRIQKFRKSQIDMLQNGVRVAALAGKPIDELLKDAAAARFRLARRFLRSSTYLASHRPILYRDCVSRAYYAIYHAARAVSFLTQPGDDYEPHDKVANGLPDDLPDVGRWQNEIKDARLKRNEADYEPFLEADPHFKGASRSMNRMADEFLRVCATYLRGKGCRL